MPYKIKDFTPIINDKGLELVDFFSIDGETTNVYLQHEENKLFKKILLGKVKNKAGRYQIDGIDVINKGFVKRHIEFIKLDNWIQRWLPTRSILVLSLFFDLNFLRKARINYAEKRYDYLSLVDTKNDLTDLKVRNEINAGIEKFLKTNMDSHKKLSRTLIKKIGELNKHNAETLFKGFPPQVKVLARAVYDTEIELKLYRNSLKFTQVIFDKIQSMNDLRNACPCEYNAKRSNNTLLKKRSDLFRFEQTKYIVAKQSKFLAININEIRLKSLKLLIGKRQLKNQLKFELKKFYKTYSLPKEEIQKINNELVSWQKVLDDIFNEHKRSEDMFLFDFLKKETDLLQDFIVYHIHNGYHKLIFTAEVEYGNKNEFAALKKHYKKKIIPVFNQGISAVTRNVKRLDLNFEWFLKSSFKLSSLNIIYAKILKALNMGKKNIIFSDFLHLLTNRDFAILMNSIEKVNEFYPDVSFTILHAKLKTIDDLSPYKKIFTPLNKHMLQTNNIAIFKEKYLEIFEDDLFSSNKLLFKKKSDELIEVEKRLWNINIKHKFREGFLFINPLLIETEFVEEKALPLNVKIVKNNRFADKNMYCGITKDKTRMFFYDKKNRYERDDEVVIYLQEKSIVWVTNKENKNE